MKKLWTAFGTLAIAAGVALGSAIDQINYSTGNLDGQTGGGSSGFAGAWDDTAGTPEITVDAGSLVPSATMRTGYATAGNSVKSPVGAGANDDFFASRQLTTAIDMNSGNTYYFSFLVSGSWTDQSTKRGWNVGFSTVGNGLTGGITIKNAYNTSNLSYASAGTETGFTAVTDFSSGNAYFIVGKMATSNGGNDLLSFKVYGPSETVAATEEWDVANNTIVSSSSLGYLVIQGRVYNTGSFYKFDEIRVGDTWDSVTIPEPGSASLILGAGLIALARRLRRR